MSQYLVLIESVGIIIPTSCTSGTCGTCMVKLISGTIAVSEPLPEGLDEETRKMILDPLGYNAIKDIDEIHRRNRRKSDDPYIKATSEKIAHHFPKIDDAERR